MLELTLAEDGGEFRIELFLRENAFWWVRGGVLTAFVIPMSQKPGLGI